MRQMGVWGRPCVVFTVRPEARDLNRGMTLADFPVNRLMQAAGVRIASWGQKWGAEQRLK